LRDLLANGGSVGSVDVVDDDVGASFGEEEGVDSSDTRAGAGDDDNLIGERESGHGGRKANETRERVEAGVVSCK
jgi:hypothetical protein